MTETDSSPTYRHCHESISTLWICWTAVGQAKNLVCSQPWPLFGTIPSNTLFIIREKKRDEMNLLESYSRVSPSPTQPGKKMYERGDETVSKEPEEIITSTAKMKKKQ